MIFNFVSAKSRLKDLLEGFFIFNIYLYFNEDKYKIPIINNADNIVITKDIEIRKYQNKIFSGKL
jgi:hypothetical protein